MAHDTAQLRSIKAKLPITEVDRTAATLEKAINLHPETVTAWEAAAQMVSFRSELRVEPRQLPDCYRTQGDGGWHLDDMVIRYHDCTLNLDDISTFNAVAPKVVQPPNPSEAIGGASARVIPTVLLQNGAVVYSGRQMIQIEKLFCINCSFDLRPPEIVPPPPGRALSQQLLLSNLENVGINLPKV